MDCTIATEFTNVADTLDAWKVSMFEGGWNYILFVIKFVIHVLPKTSNWDGLTIEYVSGRNLCSHTCTKRIRVAGCGCQGVKLHLAVRYSLAWVETYV